MNVITNQKRFALFATFILLCLSVFQLLLIFGFPLGHLAWGGAHTVLPLSLRIGSMVSIVYYIIAILVIQTRVGMTHFSSDSLWTRFGTWFFAILFLLGGPLNLASQSLWERYLMAPIAILLGILFLLVARSKTGQLSKN